MMTMEEAQERQAREMRDRIYGPGGDQNWNACRECWMKPAELDWLAEEWARIELGRSLVTWPAMGKEGFGA